MKKMLAMLLLAAMLLPGLAGAEGAGTYTLTPVVGERELPALYGEFLNSGELSTLMPGLAEGLVPQGVAYMPEENWLLFSGYRSDGGQSALIAVDLATESIVKETLLCKTDGSIYKGHAGGVAVTEKNIFISNSHKLYRIPLADFRAQGATGSCAFAEEIPVPVNSSYCSYADGVLWVGEYQYGASYTTDISHRIKTGEGYYRAWTCGYTLDPNRESEIKEEALAGGGDATPDYILATPERVQGMTTRNGLIYLSQSQGKGTLSMLNRYRNMLLEEPQAYTELNGASVPTWFLDKNALEATLFVPPMSEGVSGSEKGVYIIFESAAEEYRSADGVSGEPMDHAFLLTGF